MTTSVTIGIPTLNSPTRLAHCLKSIMSLPNSFPQDTDVRVLVCDDGSTDDNLLANKSVVHSFQVPMLVNGARKGVAITWNQLTRHFSSDYVVLLNDDILVRPDWLVAILFSLKHNPQAGMIGFNVYNGIGYDEHGVLNDPKIAVPDYVEAKLLCGTGCLSATGAAFGFVTSKYVEVGGFDSRYFCFYEEIDFAVSLLESGYVNYTLSYPILFHAGGATTSDPLNMDAQKVIRDSRKKFHEKWGMTIEALRNRYNHVGRQYIPVEWNTKLNTLNDVDE